MDSRFIILGLALLVAAVHGERQCYTCDESADNDSGKGCKEKNPKTDQIARAIVPDDKKECLFCSKWVPESGDVTRGCYSKDQYQLARDDYNLKKNKDSCKKVSGAGELCVCTGNLCNGGAKIGFSFLTVVMIALAKILY